MCFSVFRKFSFEVLKLFSSHMSLFDSSALQAANLTLSSALINDYSRFNYDCWLQPTTAPSQRKASLMQSHI